MPDLGSSRTIIEELVFQSFGTFNIAGSEEDNPIILARWKVTNNLPSGFNDQLIAVDSISISCNGFRTSVGGNIFCGWTVSDDNAVTWSDDTRGFTSSPISVFMASGQAGTFLIRSNITDIAFAIWGTDSATEGTVREVVGHVRLADGNQYSFQRIK